MDNEGIKNDEQDVVSLEKRVENLEKLADENVRLNKEILILSEYIKKYVYWRRVMFWVKLVLIVIPLIVVFVYLPPFLADAWESIQEMIVVLTDTDKLLELIVDKQIK